MPRISSDRIVALLSESLALWGVDGSVDTGDAPVVAIIRARSGAIVWVERPPADDAMFRWAVRWRAAEERDVGARELRPRPCTSITSLLEVIRMALRVDRGSPIRITPAVA